MKNKINGIKELLAEEISAIIKSTNLEIWKEPIIGFADVNHPYIRNLSKYAGDSHQMPEDVMDDAAAVLVYFLPFREELVKSNRGSGLATSEWACIYEKTNALFPLLNNHLTEVIHNLGYEAKQASEAPIFYRDEIMSHWSFRHFAYAAGLGTFGMNNMLITAAGCAGRLNGLVTNLPVETGSPQTEQACLYKRSGKCGLCLKICPAGALTADGYDRKKCYDQCLKNAEVHTEFGSSYSDNSGRTIGSEVCGKCIAGMPCAHRRP